jgi:hypothetical protein
MTSGVQPSVSIVYVYAPAYSLGCTYRFVDTLTSFPGGRDHNTVVVCNGGPPDDFVKELFSQVPRCSFFEHNNVGWDIGGFVALARSLKDDVMVCFGGSAYFRRAGWLVRMMDAWTKHGPGFYGCLSRYERSPHLNTTGFWCSPGLLQDYPYPVITDGDRAEFEYGEHALWKLTLAKGLPVKLVTWDGEYDWPDWRKAPNIFRRGDQTNCLTYYKHTDIYDEATPEYKALLQAWADTLGDPIWMQRVVSRPIPKPVQPSQLSSIAGLSRSTSTNPTLLPVSRPHGSM